MSCQQFILYTIAALVVSVAVLYVSAHDRFLALRQATVDHWELARLHWDGGQGGHGGGVVAAADPAATAALATVAASLGNANRSHLEGVREVLPVGTVRVQILHATTTEARDAWMAAVRNGNEILSQTVITASPMNPGVTRDAPLIVNTLRS